MNRENGCDVIVYSIQLFPTKFLFLNSRKCETWSNFIVTECEGKRGPGLLKSERPFRERRGLVPWDGRSSVVCWPFKAADKHPVTGFNIITVSESLCYKCALSLTCYVSCKLTFGSWLPSVLWRASVLCESQCVIT